MSFSKKQSEYLANAFHRWNIKSGATRAGKTYLDYFMIPKRIRAVAGSEGLIVFLGNTKGTLQRNIIEPLQSIWGDWVSDIKTDNTSMMFGEKVHCLGADKINSVNRIRGSSWKYLYGDELATWHPGVFDMAKSRLDKPRAIADLTLNPEFPSHWAGKFIHSNADIYLQEYTIDDNPYLDKTFVENLKKEYYGTVYYDRYILGRWVRAEGGCFPSFKRNKPGEIGNILYEYPQNIRMITFGIDFGGNKSATTFVCTGHYFRDRKPCIVALDYKRLRHDQGNIGPKELNDAWFAFQRDCRARWPADRAFADSAEQVLIKGLNQIPQSMRVDNAMKRPIMQRIRAGNILFAQGRAHIMGQLEGLIEAVENCVYDSKSNEDKRLDDGTSDIDSLDAWEYSWERHITDLVEGVNA